MRRKVIFIIKLLALVVVCIFLFLLYLFFNQESIIFVPSKQYYTPPAGSGVKEISIETADNEELVAWWTSDKENKNTIIFFHGNGGNLSYLLSRINLFKKMGYNTLMIDYRGYGDSTGEIDEEKDLYMDARAAYAHVSQKKDIPEENIILWGKSLGGVPAIYLARNKDIKALVCESTFYSAAKMGQRMYPYLPIKPFLRYKFKNYERIKDVKAPILIMHSKQDEVIPFRDGEKLYQIASEPKKFIPLKGTHDAFHKNIYKTQVKDFLEKF